MRLYSRDHEWVEEKGGFGKVGITDYAQAQLGDVVFCEAEPAGTELHAGEVAGTVESVKAASDVYTPVSGEIVEVNGAPGNDPSLLNSDPYGSWIFQIRLRNPNELSGLMDETQYKEYCRE